MKGINRQVIKLSLKNRINGKKVRSIAFRLNAVLAAVILICLLNGPAPSSVQGLVVDSSTYDTASLKWDQSENASSYHVYRSEDGEDYEYVETVTSPEYTDNDLRTGTTYSYKVKASRGFRAEPIETAEEVAVTPELAKPKISVNVEEGQVQLKIDRVDGATSYEIYRNDKKIQTQTETVFVDENAKSDKKYGYKVRAERIVTSTEENDDESAADRSVYSEFSKTKAATVISAPELNAELVDGNNIKVTWEESETYDKYRLYKGDKLLTETEGNEYTIEDLDPDTDYDLRLIGLDGDTESPAEEKLYVIETGESTNEEAIDRACQWAVDIADDDEFTYGKCPRALHYGCFFCGTNIGPNANKKGTSLIDGHSYEKTYICNALVTAAFAHGAGDEAMLEACRKCSGVAMTPQSFTKYGNWEDAGKPGHSELQKGDVLVANSRLGDSDYHHVALYIGEDQIVEATRKDWSPESIAVKDLSDNYYARFDFVMRYTGTGNGNTYELKEVEQN